MPDLDDIIAERDKAALAPLEARIAALEARPDGVSPDLALAIRRIAAWQDAEKALYAVAAGLTGEDEIAAIAAATKRIEAA